MRNILVNISATLLTVMVFTSTPVFAQTRITSWEPTLPVTQNYVVQLIRNTAYQKFNKIGEGHTCGGEVYRPKLVQYHTYYSGRDSIIHRLGIEVYVTGPYRGCQRRALYHCVVPLVIETASSYRVGNWNCQIARVER